MPKIEFFYWAECPSHERALAILQEIMAEEHIQALVEMIEVKDEVEAERYQFYGSPTIHVDGIDSAPLPDDTAQSSLTCRAYQRTDGRISPLPPSELIAAAFHRSSFAP